MSGGRWCGSTVESRARQGQGCGYGWTKEAGIGARGKGQGQAREQRCREEDPPPVRRHLRPSLEMVWALRGFGGGRDLKGQVRSIHTKIYFLKPRAACDINYGRRKQVTVRR